MWTVVYLLLYMATETYGVTIKVYEDINDCTAEMMSLYEIADSLGVDFDKKLACQPQPVVQASSNKA